MKLHPLTVGPIVGETTPNRVRIWGRGEANIIDGMPRRCFGALRWRQRGSGDWNRPRLFKMNPNFDLTGIAILNRLTPETRYEYQVGYFFSDAELSDAGFNESDWSHASAHEFTTASDDDTRPRTLVVGSCRYLLKTFLGDFFDNRGDKTFRSVNEQIDEDGVSVHQLIMMGDQIYADDLNFLNQDRSVGQFYKRYRDAFGQPHIRKLMARVPTYMTLDDHEIEDNWPSKASEQDYKTLFPHAVHAFSTYQLSHSPNIPVRGTRLTGTPNHLWYSYTDGCCDVFVTDSRTERTPAEDSPRMLSTEQMRALKRWLADGSGRVKLVVTSVPFVPDVASKENSDKWSGFPHERGEILTHIENRAIKPVVFLSGDVHATLAVELVSPSGLKIHSVVSSAFFWPYPHPTARHFVLSGTVDGGRAGKFTLKNASSVVGDDNFTRLNVRPAGMTMDVFLRKGRRRMSKRYRF